MTSSFNITTEQAVARIRERGQLGAHVNTRLDAALEDAVRLASEPARSPLHGVPYGLKDEWETLCLPTTGGSLRHEHRRSPQDSRVFSTFEQAGAVLVGKTNLSDMGLAPEAINYIVGPCRNPHDTTRTGGGSSGGAAVAVADGMQGFDWATDIGGSIRLPAAFCGVLGLRLSSETWPITQLFPTVPRKLGWMCGQGPMTHTVAQMREVLAVAAPRLRVGAPGSFEPRRALLHTPSSLGRWPTFHEDVAPHLEEALGAGSAVAAGELPTINKARDAYAGVWAAHLDELIEADDTLTFIEGARGVFRSVVFRNVFGARTFHPSTAGLLLLMALGSITIYRNKERALAKAYAVRDAFQSVWERDTLIVSPVCLYPAPRAGSASKLKLLSCTVAGNLADSTAISIPLGTFDDGLPRAVQLQGPAGCEDALLEVAERFIASRDGSSPKV